ncbi:MAG: nickel-dependent hydrogenase large subunit, partial [Desulfovibrionaceae bacterium]|nr:nickel-dependent hydrogenase large subunit [Desulfovibrionaceae bacterium]
ALHPYDGITEPHYVLGPSTKGTATDIRELDEQGRYSWLKTPLWHGHQMEVGPLARTLVAYAKKHEETVAAVDDFCGRLGAPVTALQSTLGRIAARSLELAWSAEKMQYFFDKLVANLKNGDASTANTTRWLPESWPETEVRGVGFTEAPRGALGHWVVIKNRKIERYQCIVPTTWNAAPRGPKGELGAYEASLMGTHMDIPEQPLEILRTIHSFDPCLACATHILGPDGSELFRVRVDKCF